MGSVCNGLDAESRLGLCFIAVLVEVCEECVGLMWFNMNLSNGFWTALVGKIEHYFV